VPRKRRCAKRRPILPEGLAQISLAERALWSACGPLLESDGVEWLDGDDMLVDAPRPLYHIWSSLASFMEFYAGVRSDWLAVDRPWVGGVVERLHAAWLRGDDLDALRAAIAAERRSGDPRRLLSGRR
jgi:hypothetical protein